MARPSAMEHVKWSTWTMRILLCWSTLLMVGSGEELPSTAAVRYWETMLHGGSMPSTIQAMLSPLTSHQATQLLLHTDAYLPTHATSFCEAAHIRCGPNTPNLPASDDPADANLFGYHHRKSATVKAEPASDNDDANLFGYHYGKPERVKAHPASDDPADANLFNYHYSKAVPAKAELVQAPPASNESDDANLFNYHYVKAEPVKARPVSDDPDDANLFSYRYRKAATTKAHSVQARPVSHDNPDDANLFNYHYGKAEPVQVRPASDDRDDANLFNYHYNKAANAKAEPVQARPASDAPDDANLFSYTGYRYKGVKDGNASPGLQSRISKETGRALRALMSSTIHEIPGVFFREEQVLVSGATIHVNLATYPSSKKDERAFLPRKLAQVFPLSDEGAEGISSMLGFTRDALQNTIDRCNVRNHADTEVSACLSSVEDIADFVSSTMGSSQPINAYDSLLNATNASFSGKTFLVESVKPLKKDVAEPAVTCHDMSFPFRVFYCHCAPRTMVFRVTLKGEDGTSHERLSVCHYDTSSWNPEHLSFSELNTKPGEAEACHWLGKSWRGQSGWVFSFA